MKANVFFGKYNYCIMKNYTYSNEKGKFEGRYLKQHMRGPQFSQEERSECLAVLFRDDLWKNMRSVQAKLFNILSWEAWKSRAKSLEEQTLFEFYEEKEKNAE